MVEFTIPAADEAALIAGATTQAERAAVAAMIVAAAEIDAELAVQNWRNNTANFIGPLGRLDAQITALSGNAGLLVTDEIAALRNRLAALREELGLGGESADADADNEGSEAEDLAIAAAGPMPVTTTANGGFEAFFAANLPNVTHFTASEFLYKGASHASNGLNTDPPKKLWPNVVPLVRVLNQLRADIGAPIRLLSIYRSPAYNSAIGGATGSYHKKFLAADFTTSVGSPADWAAKARALRSAGAFSGGIGTYGSFVHVDVRGSDADWNG